MIYIIENFTFNGKMFQIGFNEKIINRKKYLTEKGVTILYIRTLTGYQYHISVGSKTYCKIKDNG